MALATTCPSCSTSFKVNPEQLKLRRGLVRCGVCQHVFSGVEQLRYVSDARAGSVGTATVVLPTGQKNSQNASQPLPQPQLGVDTGADIEADSMPEPANSDDDEGPATIADDLRTAFFLPETKFHLSEQTQNPDDVDDAPELLSASTPGNQSAEDPGATVERDPHGESNAADADSDEIEAGLPARKSGRKRNRGRGRQRKQKQNKAEQATPDEVLAPAKPIWPILHEDFDEPDIQAPDTTPATLDESVDALARALSGQTHDGLERNNAAFVNAMEQERQTPPAPNPTRTTDEDAIDYFGQAQGSSFNFDVPPRRVWLLAGLLTMILAVQVLLVARDAIAARFPPLHAPLERLAAPFGLKVDLPWDNRSVSIRSFELAAASNERNNSRYTMIMLLGNEAHHPMKWPAVELTLTNGIGEILVRKVLLPDQYLPADSMRNAGIPGKSEKVIRVAMGTDNVNPVGYSAVLFYP